MDLKPTKEMRDLIAEHPFFQGMDPQYLDLIAGCARNVRFMPDEMVFREGESADAFYLIRHGKVLIGVQVPGRGLVPIQTLGPGEMIGWSWLFPPHHWHFDAKALEVTRALAFDAKCLRDKCDEDPRLGYQLMRRFAAVLIERLQAARMQLLDMYGVHTAQPGA